MERVHVCDMMLQRGVRHVDGGLGRKVERRLADLGACAPSMFRLEFGEIEWSVLLQQDGLVLRLDLVPRRQGWLRNALTVNASAHGHLQDEADMIFADLQDAQVKVTRLAHSMLQDRPSATSEQRTRDSLAGVIARHSNRAWHALRAHQQVQIAFPELPPFVVDAGTVRLEGTIAALARAWMRLEHIDCTVPIPHRDLDVRLEGNSHRLAEALHIGTRVTIEAQLHRCLFTRVIVGASL